MSERNEPPVALTKPLGRKSYGSIGHLALSRTGPADHYVNAGQEDTVTRTGRTSSGQPRTIWVQAKLDGSCTAVARINGQLVALGRAGYPARSSTYEMHHRFADWVDANTPRFFFLQEGQRLVGEWLAQAHGTIYDLTGREPWVPFDLMTGDTRTPYLRFAETVGQTFALPSTMQGPAMPDDAVAALDHHGAADPEGCVYRCEDNDRVLFLAKYVRPGKVDGLYLGAGPVWNQPVSSWNVASTSLSEPASAFRVTGVSPAELVSGRTHHRDTGVHRMSGHAPRCLYTLSHGMWPCDCQDEKEND